MHKYLATVSVLPFALSCSTLGFNEGTLKETSSGGTRSAVVSYNPEGVESLIENRRKSSFKKMEEFCGVKKYKISKEETVAVDPTEGEDLATLGASKLRQIHFVCE